MAQDHPDRRIQRTRRLLQDALAELILEQGYEKVTVQAIIDRADVGRSTFYSHFLDKEDLFLSSFDVMKKMFEEHLMSPSHHGNGPWDLSLRMFQHAPGHHHLYKAMAGKQGGQLAVTNMRDFLMSLLSDHFQQEFPGPEERVVPPEIFAYFMVNSFMSLLIWWLDNDMPYSPERMNEIYRTLTEPSLRAAL